MKYATKQTSHEQAVNSSPFSSREVSLTRRQILRSVGLTGAAAAAGPLIFRPIAHAAEIPKRLIVFYTIGGVDPAWDPTGTRDSWMLSPHLEPLLPFKNKLNLISGLKSTARELYGSSSTDGHFSCNQHALSSWQPAPNAKPGGVSFDNFISEKLKAAGRSGPIDHMYVQVGASGVDYHDRPQRPSVTSSGQVRNPLNSPTDILKLYFPMAPAPSTPGGLDAAKQSTQLLDFLKGEYDRYGKADKMDLASKKRFADHLERLNDLARLLPNPDRAISKACYKPTPAASQTMEVNNRFTVETVATAFACDTARVALIDMGFGVNQNIVGGVSEFNLGAGLQTVHELGHQVHGGNLKTNAAARAKLLHSFRLQGIDPLAQLLTMLDSIDEADGKTLLDHSVVLWCQQSSDGNHNMTNFRYLTAGSCGGAIKTNQYIKTNGSSITDVWAAIAKAMGIADVTGIADPFTFDGPLPGLLV
jgi:Protein of unknown function (DUF1552)